MDANTYYLNKYLEEQEEKELVMERFEAEIDDLGILDDYEALRGLYYEITDEYEGYIMPSFEQYLKDRV